MTDKQLVLYTGTLCPLCTEARNRIYSVMPPGLKLREIPVDDDADLKATHGLRIPVFAVCDQSGQLLAEKAWPFSAGQARRLLAEQGLLEAIPG